MSLQNRVDPWGRLHAVSERGMWMGNRGGCFHDANRQLKPRHWVSPRWIVCLLNFRNRSRVPMSPGKYTELFFLDEATALAAGHRPCFECRREAARLFRSLWPHPARTLADLDRTLHRERLSPKPSVDPASLPGGAMVQHAGAAWLVRDGALHRWSFSGYGDSIALPPYALLLTPLSTVEVLRRGYRPL